MSFRNRCTVLGGGGPILLSIPLMGGRGQHNPMKEVRIRNEEHWQARHWKSIVSCYNKSPWFEFYHDELERLYQRRYEFLLDWNFDCFRWVTDKLSISVPVSLSSGYRRDYPEEGYLDLRNRLMPATINRSYPEVAAYPQVFADRFDFVPHLSILDRLFCQGPVFP